MAILAFSCSLMNFVPLNNFLYCRSMSSKVGRVSLKDIHSGIYGVRNVYFKNGNNMHNHKNTNVPLAMGCHHAITCCQQMPVWNIISFQTTSQQCLKKPIHLFNVLSLRADVSIPKTHTHHLVNCVLYDP